MMKTGISIDLHWPGVQHISASGMFLGHRYPNMRVLPEKIGIHLIPDGTTRLSLYEEDLLLGSVGVGGDLL